VFGSGGKVGLVELSFVIAAVKRRPWLIALFIVLGMIPGLMIGSDEVSYESSAVLLVSPPAQGQAQATTSDRYVVNQLSVLRDTGLAERVATAIGGDVSTQQVRDAVRITQRPGTDLVEVAASASDPELARNIAEQYVTTYIADLRDRTEKSQGPDLKAIEGELERISADLEQIDTQIGAVVAPFLPEPGQTADQGAVAPPALESIAPGLVTRRTLLLDEYGQQLDNRNQLAQLAKLRVTSEIVQSASLPTIPVTTTSNKKVVLAGAFAGAVLGVVAAAMAAAMSRRVLDARHVADILQTPVVGKLRKDRKLAKSAESAMDDLPTPCVGLVDQLCVRAEAHAREGRGLTVAVAGTQHRAAATTLAMALAGRFAHTGSRVVLIDADHRHPDISRMFNVPPEAGIPALLARAALVESGTASQAQLRKLRPYTNVGDVAIVGVGSKAAGASLRRQHVSNLINVAANDFDVVVIDVGAVLDAASSLQICNLADAVVLAVPGAQQEVASLEVVGRQLGDRRGELLPVFASLPRQLPFSHAAASEAPPVDQVGQADIEIGEPFDETERAERDRAEQARAERDRAEQERAERDRAEQDRAEQERAEQARADQERADQERADQAIAEQLKPSDPVEVVPAAKSAQPQRHPRTKGSGANRSSANRATNGSARATRPDVPGEPAAPTESTTEPTEGHEPLMER
jgi:Mrp family chromosome partitioning ATPase